MKTRSRSLAAGIALTAIVIGLFLVLSGAGPALSSATLAALAVLVQQTDLALSTL